MFRSSRKRAVLAAFAVLALAPLAAPQAAAQEKEITVIVPNPSALNVWPVHTAIGEGYMAEEGLKVNVEAVDGSSQVLQALAAGQAQIGNPGPAPLLAARERGEDVVFLYNLNPKSSFGIVVREESSYQKPEDLKGKVIGVGTADGAEVGFTRTRPSRRRHEGERGLHLPAGRRRRHRRGGLRAGRHRSLCGGDQRRGDHVDARPEAPRDHAGRVQGLLRQRLRGQARTTSRPTAM